MTDINEKMLTSTESNNNSTKDEFDQVLDDIGDNGKFQKSFNIIFNFLLVIATTMSYSNSFQFLSVPDHWCYVPGRENTTYTLEEWKNLTLPVELDTRGRVSPSKCKMYNATYEELITKNYNENNTIGCQNGWEYDKTWYQETAPSQENWVCDNAIQVSNIHSGGKAGDVVGTIIFGQLGDIIGRRPVFYWTMSALIIGRLLGAFTAQYYYVFMLANFIATLASTAVFQSPLVIAMEISNENSHAHVAMMQSVGWSLGMTILPLICWWLGHWFYFMIATMMPCLLFFLPYKLMIESPRWLTAKGKPEKAIEQLKIIARINGTKVPTDVKSKLNSSFGKTETIYGFMSLFTSWRLTKNTIMVVLNWSAVILTYYIIVLNVPNLGGNPFLDYIFQALAELPAYIIARYCCDKFGRRITQITAFGAAVLTCIPLTYVITDPAKQTFISILAILIQFFTSASFYGCSLIALEIFPTCIRSSGLSIAVMFSTLCGMLGPYVVFLGTNFNARYPYYIIFCLMFVGAAAAFFLPETLYQKLPETLMEAHRFGKEQSYFSMPKKPVKEEPLLKNNSIINSYT